MKITDQNTETFPYAADGLDNHGGWLLVDSVKFSPGSSVARVRVAKDQESMRVDFKEGEIHLVLASSVHPLDEDSGLAYVETERLIAEFTGQVSEEA